MMQERGRTGLIPTFPHSCQHTSLSFLPRCTDALEFCHADFSLCLQPPQTVYTERRSWLTESRRVVNFVWQQCVLGAGGWVTLASFMLSFTRTLSRWSGVGQTHRLSNLRRQGYTRSERRNESMYDMPVVTVRCWEQAFNIHKEWGGILAFRDWELCMWQLKWTFKISQMTCVWMHDRAACIYVYLCWWLDGKNTCLIAHLWFLVTLAMMETIRESSQVGNGAAASLRKFVCSCLCGPFSLYMLICENVYPGRCVFKHSWDRFCAATFPLVPSVGTFCIKFRLKRRSFWILFLFV